MTLLGGLIGDPFLWIFTIVQVHKLVVLGYGLDDQGFESRQGLGILLFTTVSRRSLGTTQPLIQWVAGALSLGVKRPRCEADHTPPPSAEVKNAWSYTAAPQIRLHGVVLG